MGNDRERSKRGNLKEKKEWLHYPKWIEANKEEDAKYQLSKSTLTISLKIDGQQTNLKTEQSLFLHTLFIYINIRFVL